MGANQSLAPITLVHAGDRWYQAGVGRLVQNDLESLYGLLRYPRNPYVLEWSWSGFVKGLVGGAIGGAITGAVGGFIGSGFNPAGAVGGAVGGALLGGLAGGIAGGLTGSGTTGTLAGTAAGFLGPFCLPLAGFLGGAGGAAAGGYSIVGGYVLNAAGQVIGYAAETIIQGGVIYVVVRDRAGNFITMIEQRLFGG